jgi:phosphoribosylanthranilate isomerase
LYTKHSRSQNCDKLWSCSNRPCCRNAQRSRPNSRLSYQRNCCSHTPPIGTFLLTSHTSVSDIIKHHQKTNTNTIQIVDYLSDGTYSQLKEALPSVKIVQVIHVINENSVVEAIRISQSVDAILLDSGNPNLKIKVLGGTGRVHNWKLSRKIREKVYCPVFLAGGLNPDNVKDSIEIVEPYAVDVCSGVRSNGLLDIEKLDKFFTVVLK